MIHVVSFFISLIIIILGAVNVFSYGAGYIGGIQFIPGDKIYLFPGITSMLIGLFILLVTVIDGHIKDVVFIKYLNKGILVAIKKGIKISYSVLDRFYVFLPKKMMLAYRFYRLKNWAMSKYLEGDQEYALQLANELLMVATNYEESWNYGNALHWGHTIKGLVLFDNGEFSSAQKELFLSIKVPLSPQLEYFGPQMILVNRFNKNLRNKYLKKFNNNRKLFREKG